jgi:hypothetical protein
MPMSAKRPATAEFEKELLSAISDAGPRRKMLTATQVFAADRLADGSALAELPGRRADDLYHGERGEVTRQQIGLALDSSVDTV